MLDISHECLLRKWDRIQSWSEEEREFLTAEAGRVQDLLAEREYAIGEYYENRGENRAAKFQYAKLTESYTPSRLAEDAEELKDLPEVLLEEESLLDLDAFEEGAVLSDAELNTHRAKENLDIDQITINDQDQDADVTENVAVGNTTGNNTISSDSFTNASGFTSTVQNTGNNVLIQHSTIINVSMDTSTE